ncbi:MAG: heat-inducible transcriptional repressor HrcA [Gammaproteobacteria bacterium]|nr:MAG: heat-inducible transcriptional repressor HrcA [Gammaproteobacteria bacterium]
MSKEQGQAEPSERARLILRALIEHYVRDGQPVGSRTLARSTGLSLSPASIRNVMADLEELGFIASPHTSAGRVPTAKGYRFFVDTLVKLQPPKGRELKRLESQLSEQAAQDAKQAVAAASEALSALTSLAGLVTLPRQPHVQLRQVEFLPLSDRRVLAILIVNDSEVQNRILHMERDYSAEELRRAANYLNEHFRGQELRAIRERVVEQLSETRATMNRLMIDAVAIAEKALELELNRDEFVVSGETKLMDFEELSDIETLRQLFEAFSQKRDLLRLLDRSIAANGVQIFIGEESGYQILDECSLVTAPYRVDDEVVGVLGVIGPTRMAYERVIPIVDITARILGSALNSSH